MYNNGGEIDTDSHFKLFFDYYNIASSEDSEQFIDIIKNYEFITYYDKTDEEYYRGRASSLYFPTSDLIRYFEPKDDVHFVSIDEYISLLGIQKEEQLKGFLIKLGIRMSPEVIEKVDSGYLHKESESFIDGLIEYISFVEQSQNIEDSLFLWNLLLDFINNGGLLEKVKYKTISTRPDGRYNYRRQYVDSITIIELKNRKWLLDSNYVFVSPSEITIGKLSEKYDLSSGAAIHLIEYLGISDDNKRCIEVSVYDKLKLTDSQIENIEFYNSFIEKFEEYGFSEDDLDAFYKYVMHSKASQISQDNDDSAGNGDNSDIIKNVVTGSSDESNMRDSNLDVPNISDEEAIEKSNDSSSKIVRDIITKNKKRNSINSEINSEEIDIIDIDQDEFTPATVNYSKKIEQAKDKSAAEIEKIVHLEELQTKAAEAKKYSFGWFKALLDLESLNNGEANTNSKEVSISFAKVERDTEGNRTLILKHPNRYIPQFMEDLADIPLVLYYGDKTKNVAIEVTNIVSYTLRVKMKNSTDIDGIDLSKVTAATIDAKSPVFLLNELKKQFIEMGEECGFSDDYDMQSNLCENIEFVFGPPGTGKTTYLAKKVLIPMMNNKDCKVLVLTPTNKSADVLVNRIMEVDDSKEYENWLVRFGATGDERIEQSPVFKDKTFDIRKVRRNVTVTTIARFPYDFYMPQGARLFLNGINWDYIVIDEASMIPIVNIIYPLYKQNPEKFIIAGDPFQIEPITSVELWKDQNIYKMVKLNSFSNPTTVPHNYKVVSLQTQYRSVPEIGTVFSRFAYDGILKHDRTSESLRPLNIGDKLSVEPLNIIKFPVSRYESIYRPKRLNNSSSYQIYSALFTYEFTNFISKLISENNKGERFRIGVIAPYRAQADLIEKLVASERYPAGIDIQVGTIHGFQGDECDIIFVVFNTPAYISESKDEIISIEIWSDETEYTIPGYSVSIPI